MSCLQVEPYEVLECQSVAPMRLWAEGYPDGWLMYMNDKPVYWYENPHYEQWKRGKPTKEAKAKRLLAENWMPEDWTPAGHSDGSHHLEFGSHKTVKDEEVVT